MSMSVVFLKTGKVPRLLMKPCGQTTTYAEVECFRGVAVEGVGTIFVSFVSSRAEDKDRMSKRRKEKKS